jgi:translation initiation factor IF-2
VKAKLSEQLSPSITQRVTGEAEIAQVFDINVKRRVTKPIAGCKVRNGLISRNAKVRVLRDREIIYDGMFAFHSSWADPGYLVQKS